MTASELAAGLRTELHDVKHARMREVLRRDLERGRRRADPDWPDDREVVAA